MPWAASESAIGELTREARADLSLEAKVQILVTRVSAGLAMPLLLQSLLRGICQELHT